LILQYSKNAEARALVSGVIPTTYKSDVEYLTEVADGATLGVLGQTGKSGTDNRRDDRELQLTLSV